MMSTGYASPFKQDAPLWLVGFQQLWLGSENLRSGNATLTTLSPSWIAETLIASYSIWTTGSLPFASPWRQRTTTNSLSLTPQFQENRRAASPPACTESYAHWSVLSVWFPPPEISKTRYCQVSLRARQTSRNKTLCYLQGEETPVFCSCL